MKSYYRVMLGGKSIHAEDCRAGGFIGADYGINQDLTKKLPDEWRVFNKEFIPIYLSKHPDKTRIGAGLSCGSLWTLAKGIKIDDIVLCPDGSGSYHVGQVVGNYQYAPGQILPHRRSVQWLSRSIGRAEMSEALRNSTGSIGAVSDITKYASEIEGLLGGACVPAVISNDPTIEDPSEFAMEKHLEDFLAENWEQTELGREYDIYEEDGEVVGKQYQTDTGPLDILAISKNKKKLLVVELKKGRASDAVVGQVLRYMGYVKEELAEDNQTVEGVIIAQEDDPKLKRAISMVSSIKFFRYQVSFKLIKG